MASRNRFNHFNQNRNYQKINIYLAFAKTFLFFFEKKNFNDLNFSYRKFCLFYDI